MSSTLSPYVSLSSSVRHAGSLFPASLHGSKPLPSARPIIKKYELCPLERTTQLCTAFTKYGQEISRFKEWIPVKMKRDVQYTSGEAALLKSVGFRVQFFRKVRGLSQEQLAEMSGPLKLSHSIPYVLCALHTSFAVFPYPAPRTSDIPFSAS